MKDSYSFDIDDAGLQKSYDLHRDAYIKIFNRLGFEYVIVHAMSGAMGGSASEEFLAVAENGEDTFVRSPGGYAANVEAVRHFAAARRSRTTMRPPRTWRTPRTRRPSTTLVALANARFPRRDRPWHAADTLKNVVLMVTEPDGSRTPLVIGLPGDREVDLKRLAAQLEPAEAVPFGEADFAAYPQLVKGYIGPTVLGVESARPRSATWSTRGSVAGTRWLTGANEPGRHVFDLVVRAGLHSRRDHRGRRDPRGRPGPGRLRTAAAGPRHRDGPHLPAGPEVRRGARD